MQYAVYIAAAAVIGLLIALVALALAWMRKTVLRRIRSKTMGLLNLYDTLLEEKSRALNQLSAAAPQAPAPAGEGSGPSPEAGQDLSAALVTMAERSNAMSHRDSHLAGLYQTIRRNFAYQPESVLAQAEEGAPWKPGPATAILGKLDYDSVYQLSTLTDRDQLDILEGILGQEELPVLRSYAEGVRQFRVLEFYDYLRDLAATEPHAPRLWVAEDALPSFAHSDRVEIAVDQEICEGYQLELDNRLYDYSIKTRELS